MCQVNELTKGARSDNQELIEVPHPHLHSNKEQECGWSWRGSKSARAPRPLSPHVRGSPLVSRSPMFNLARSAKHHIAPLASACGSSAGGTAPRLPRPRPGPSFPPSFLFLSQLQSRWLNCNFPACLPCLPHPSDDALFHHAASLKVESGK